MFDFFKKIFFKKNDHKKNNFELTNDYNFLCSINFELNSDGTINIVCYWPNFDDSNSFQIEPISKQFGALLHMINSGFLTQEIVSTLTNTIDKNNYYDSSFVHYSMLRWLDSLNNKEKPYQNNDDNIPIIKPSNVFKQYGIK